MPFDQYFSSTHQQARTKFLAAAHGAKAQVSNYVIPEQEGTDGSELVVGVAEIRGSEQPDLVVIISGRTASKGSAVLVARSDFWPNVSMKGCPRLWAWPWCMPSIPSDLSGFGE